MEAPTHIVFQGYSQNLALFQPEHVDALWKFIELYPDNARLFEQIYGSAPSSLPAFRALMTDPWINSRLVQYTCLDCRTSEAKGWMVLHAASKKTRNFAACAMFTPLHRGEVEAHSLLLFATYIFDRLQYVRGEFRVGTQANDPSMNFIATVRRQTIVKEKSDLCDCHEMTRDQWPALKAALVAYFGSGSTTEEHVPSQEIRAGSGT